MQLSTQTLIFTLAAAYALWASYAWHQQDRTDSLRDTNSADEGFRQLG
jgi:hypothetical protein